jgi:ribosomal protein L11 methyltransferase
VLSVRVPARALEDDVAALLLALGGSAVRIEGDALSSYLTHPTDAAGLEALLGRVRERLAALACEHDLPETTLVLSCSREPDRDWTQEWRHGLRPRRVGPFLVTPSWCRPEASAPLTIVLDPQMAFGTGEHATTRGMLRLLAEAVRPGDRVLDVGTGSGILAIAAVKLGAGSVRAAETDADALENAAENLRRNGVDGRIALLHARVDAAFLRDAGTPRFDVVVANVLSGVLHPLLPSFREALAPDGRLLLGGILEEEADAMLAAAVAAGFVLRVEDVEDEWWGALLERVA